MPKECLLHAVAIKIHTTGWLGSGGQYGQIEQSILFLRCIGMLLYQIRHIILVELNGNVLMAHTRLACVNVCVCETEGGREGAGGGGGICKCKLIILRIVLQ